jgi:hypothetical protein
VQALAGAGASFWFFDCGGLTRKFSPGYKSSTPQIGDIDPEGNLAKSNFTYPLGVTMKSTNGFCKLFVGLVLMGQYFSAAAQTPPGSPLADTAVSQDVTTMFSLAAQIYPTVFSGGTGWYSYSGYTYKYFPAASIYAGVKDGDLYLLGGAYGSNLTPRGTVPNVIASLQKTLLTVGVNSPADFSNIYPFKTIADIALVFSELTVSTYTKSNLVNITLTSSIQLSVLGTEVVEGTTATKLQVTVDGSNLTRPNVAQMWADANGNIVKLVLNGFEYAANLRQSIGVGLVSSILLGLAGPETPSVKAAIANELKNPAFSQKLQKRTLDGKDLSSLVFTISDASGTTNVITEITDFGKFTMATRFETNTTSALGTTSRMEITSAKLR